MNHASVYKASVPLMLLAISIHVNTEAGFARDDKKMQSMESSRNMNEIRRQALFILPRT